MRYFKLKYLSINILLVVILFGFIFTMSSKDGLDDIDEIKKQNGISINICYEAFYPYYVATESKKVKFLTLLSSEIFMNGSKWGKHQYNNIIKSRAIENNIPLVKSAYGGTSMIISPIGEIDSASQKPFDLFNVKVAASATSSTWFSTYGLYSIFGIILVLFLVSFCQISKGI